MKTCSLLPYKKEFDSVVVVVVVAWLFFWLAFCCTVELSRRLSIVCSKRGLNDRTVHTFIILN